MVLEPRPPPAATSPLDHPSVEPREARKPGASGFRSSSGIPTFKICQIIFLSEELSSKYISIFPDVFKYTGAVEPRPREYAPPPHHHLKPPAPCRSEIISRLTRYSRETNRGNIVDHRFPLRPQNEEYLIGGSISWFLSVKREWKEGFLTFDVSIPKIWFDVFKFTFVDYHKFW